MLKLATRLTMFWLLFNTTAIAQVQVPFDSISRRNLETAKALDRFIWADLDEVPLPQFVEFLRDNTGLRFHVVRSKGDEELDDNARISVSAGDVRLSTLLELALRPHEGTYLIKDGIVVILSEDSAMENLAMRFFDCREILATIKPRKVPTYRALQFASWSPGEQLTDLLLETVDPDSWEENGGYGRVMELNGMLVIRQTEVNMLAIATVLQELGGHQQDLRYSRQVSESVRARFASGNGPDDH